MDLDSRGYRPPARAAFIVHREPMKTVVLLCGGIDSACWSACIQITPASNRGVCYRRKSILCDGADICSGCGQNLHFRRVVRYLTGRPVVSPTLLLRGDIRRAADEVALNFLDEDNSSRNKDIPTSRRVRNGYLDLGSCGIATATSKTQPSARKILARDDIIWPAELPNACHNGGPHPTVPTLFS